MTAGKDMVLIDGRFYVSVEVAAQLCGVGVQSMRAWQKQPNPPPRDEDTGLYCVMELGEWIRREQVLKRGKGGAYPYMPDLSRINADGSGATTKETRLEKARADKMEMEIAKMAGDLIPYEDVKQSVSNMVVRAKTRLLRLPTVTAPLVCGMTDVYAVQESLEKSVRDALDELSEDWQDGIEDEQE